MKRNRYSLEKDDDDDVDDDDDDDDDDDARHAYDRHSRRLCNAIIDSGGVQRRRKEQHRFAVLISRHTHIYIYTMSTYTVALRVKCQTPLTRHSKFERAPIIRITWDDSGIATRFEIG